MLNSKTDFGFDWLFALTDSEEMPCPGAGWRNVTLPHDWSVDYPIDEQYPSRGSGGYARTGIGWYKKEFTYHPQTGRRASLLFDGVMMNCRVFVNGAPALSHVYGYTPFSVELNGLVKDGVNEITVMVDNSRQPASRWYSGSGITRNVHLIETNELYIPINGISVTTDGESHVRVSADICGDAQGAMLTVCVTDESGTVVSKADAQAEAAASVELSIPDAAKWDVDSPNLYKAEIALCRENETVHRENVCFGIRKAEFDSRNGFLLNGTKRILKGVCLHHDGGCVGAAVPPAIWERRLKKLKKMGVNAVRCSHNPPDEALLDLCDRLGFAVMDEAFDEWQITKQKEYGSNTHQSRGYSEWFDDCWQDDLTAMIKRDRNHPSIVIWSIGNEVPEQISEGGAALAAKMADFVHKLDATRPITQGCDQLKAEPVPAYGEFLEKLDIVGVNYADRWRDRTETFFNEEKDEHPNWLLIGTEDVSVGGTRGEHDLVTPESVWGPTQYFARMLKAEKLWKYLCTHKFVAGSFMWTGVDYLGESDWPSKNSTSGVIDTCGFEKDGYHFYKSIWNKDEPELHAFPGPDNDYPAGTVYPLIVYTNCFSAEVLADGRSYGVKAYQFPAVGMTKHWGHTGGKAAPVTTNDLHLAWDIPSETAVVTVIGRDEDGNEVLRRVLKKPGKAEGFEVKADKDTLKADGRDVLQLDITLLDKDGLTATGSDREITVTARGCRLSGMDNGDPTDHTMYGAGHRRTFYGKAYAVISSERGAEEASITVRADGLGEKTINVKYR